MNTRLSIIIFALLMGCQTTKDMGSTDNKEEAGKENQKIEHDLSMYAAATETLVRHIIALPKKENEFDYKIELYVGLNMEVDCNKHQLAGELLEKTVSGWGYPYFEFESSGQVMSTKMACPEESLHGAFVHANSMLIRYNSKLPIVVYTAGGYEVKYRIWKRDGKEYSATTE